jgi:hypothetical protein
MRLRYAPFYFILLLLAACQTLNVPAPTTFNQKALAAYSALDAATQSTATLAVAGKLSKGDAQNVKDQIVNLKAGVDIATQIHENDPAAGDDRLAMAISGLTALQAYLAGRKRP